MKIFNLFFILVLPFATHAARVAVTDSGTDFSHEWLQGRALTNASEVAGNFVDDDRNGKVDDVVGWNFIDNYGKIFFPDHLDVADEKLFKIFEAISRIQAGTETEEDKKFMKENVSDLDEANKKALVDRLNFYGQYAHSTHCSGIISALSPESKIMSNRVFPDTPPAATGLMALGEKKTKRSLADIFYKIVAAISNGSFDQVGLYLKERNIDIANYSLGISLQTIAKLALGVKGIKDPTPEQLSAETLRIAAQYEPLGKKWMSDSPGTLFVIAAGNDGSDNDKLPVFPAVVRAENSITVAATKGNGSLADFSNYGIKSVDLAAPGVAILSSVPSKDHKQLLPMSGTSMATPYVVGVSAKVKDLNPKLTPSEVKLVLMSTVDVKDWLKNKVISSGVVNPARAYAAAEKSKTMALNEAISFAKMNIKDLPETKNTPLKLMVHNPLDAETKRLAKDLVF